MARKLAIYPIFLPLEQPFLALSRNICIPGYPFLHFGDRCKSKGFLLDARGSKEQRVTVPFPEFLSFYGPPIYDASVSPTISPTISLSYSAVNSIYSHCAFAFDGNAACEIECRETFARTTKRMSYTVKSKIST